MRVVNHAVAVCLLFSLGFALASFQPGWIDSQGAASRIVLSHQVGHFQLVGLLHDAPVDILLDTGAANTVVDLSYCRANDIPTRDTGRLGGGAGGITLAIYALDGATLSLDGRPLRSDGIYAVDLTHVNEGLVAKGASRVHGVLGADVLTYHQAVIDYVTMSVFFLSSKRITKSMKPGAGRCVASTKEKL